MNSIVQIHVGSTRRVLFHEFPGARAKERVAGGIAPRSVGLGFNDTPGTAVPLELATNQLAGAIHR